jgi:hypothetical protein
MPKTSRARKLHLKVAKPTKSKFKPSKKGAKRAKAKSKR